MLLEGGYLSTGNPTGGPGNPTTKTVTSSTRLATEQATADDLPDYTQSETSPGSNLFDTVTPEDVEARLAQESWFNPNDPMFGEGGFDVTNSDHVTAYQEMYNELMVTGESRHRPLTFQWKLLLSKEKMVEVKKRLFQIHPNPPRQKVREKASGGKEELVLLAIRQGTTSVILHTEESLV